MGFYRDRIVPSIIDVVMRNADAARRRAVLVPQARGRVLEIGIGSGLNLPFYSRDVTALVGVEPSAKLAAMTREKTPGLPFPVQVLERSAEELPLDDRSIELFAAPPLPGTVHARRDYVYYPPIAHIPADAAPPLGGRNWLVTAEVDVYEGDDVQGVLYARGSHNVGHTFFVKDGQLQFDYNALGRHYRVAAPVSLGKGRHELAARFDRNGKGGTLTLCADGADLASVEIDKIVRMLGSTGLDVGRDALSPVVDDYEAPFPFTGTIERITFAIRSRADAAEIEATAKAELAKE